MLLNVLVYAIIAIDLKVRKRWDLWPRVFQCNGDIRVDRPNMGSAVNTSVTDRDGKSKIYDILYKRRYESQGDRGAAKYKQGSWIRRKKFEITEANGKKYYTYCDLAYESNYPPGNYPAFSAPNFAKQSMPDADFIGDSDWYVDQFQLDRVMPERQKAPAKIHLVKYIKILRGNKPRTRQRSIDPLGSRARIGEQ